MEKVERKKIAKSNDIKKIASEYQYKFDDSIVELIEEAVKLIS